MNRTWHVRLIGRYRYRGGASRERAPLPEPWPSTCTCTCTCMYMCMHMDMSLNLPLSCLNVSRHPCALRSLLGGGGGVTQTHARLALGAREALLARGLLRAERPPRPVAVVTASSRISRNSRAGWPTVLHQRAQPCEGCPMFIHPDGRPRRTAARCQSVLGCWQSPLATGWTQERWRSGMARTF